MGYGTGGCTFGSDYDDESYEEYQFKQNLEEQKDKDYDELYKLRKEAVIKDAEINRLKIRVNALIAEINTSKRKPLTDDQIFDALCKNGMLGSQGQYEDQYLLDIARVIEKVHGIKI